MIVHRLSLLAVAAVAIGIAVMGFSAWDSASAGAPANSGDIVPGQFIVLVNEGYDPAQVAADHAAVPLHVYRLATRGFAARLSEARVQALLADPRVNNVVPDRTVSISCHKSQHPCSGGGGGGSSQMLPLGVSRIGANQVWGTATGSGIGVAVIDTGADFNHADLSPASSCFTSFSSCQDDNGHGTHVAGTIAALNNSQDVVGVAPGATLYAVKVLNQSGSGSWSSVIAGVDWVTANAGTVKVANMSLGGSGSNTDATGNTACGVEIGDSWNNNGIPEQVIDPLHQAICNSVAAGITYVVAAGNDPYTEVSQQVPAAYPEVIAVASTTAIDGSNACGFFNGTIKADTASYFTTDGLGVSVSGPGEDKEDINKACFIKTLGILSLKLGGGTTRMSGTSMASPHVAGVAALILEDHPGFSPADIRTRIESSAVRQGTAPLNSPSGAYTFDGEREGVAWAPGATQ